MTSDNRLKSIEELSADETYHRLDYLINRNFSMPARWDESGFTHLASLSTDEAYSTLEVVLQSHREIRQLWEHLNNIIGLGEMPDEWQTLL